MPVAVHSVEPRFLFFFNLKVASRSLLAALREAFPGLRTYPQPAFRPGLYDGDWPRFLMVRSPWARAVSCYRNKCLGAPASVARDGKLEACHRHLLRALSVWPFSPQAGAARLAELSFSDFVHLLSRARDGDSHFRLQVDVLRDAPEAGSRLAWALRASRTALQVWLTHWSTPRFLRPALSLVSPTPASVAARDSGVHLIRLEDLPGAWEEVEESLGRRLPLPWLTRTANAEEWQEVYDDETRAMIGSFYAADVEAFGYSAP